MNATSSTFKQNKHQRDTATGRTIATMPLILIILVLLINLLK